jgi:hypothetical protein
VYRLSSSGSPYRIRLNRDWPNKSGPIDRSSQERSTTEPKRRLTRCRIGTVSCRLWRFSDNSHPDTFALVHPMAASSQAASTGGRRRKTHNKSRNGCAQCKKRHYKVSLFLPFCFFYSSSRKDVRSDISKALPLTMLPVRRDISNVLQLQTPQLILQLKCVRISNGFRTCRKTAKHRRPTALA